MSDIHTYQYVLLLGVWLTINFIFKINRDREYYQAIIEGRDQKPKPAPDNDDKKAKAKAEAPAADETGLRKVEDPPEPEKSEKDKKDD